MDLFTIVVGFGSLLLFLYTRRPKKEDVVVIQMVPLRVNKCIQTEVSSPMSSISSIDLQFVFDETYLERNCDNIPNENSGSLVQQDCT